MVSGVTSPATICNIIAHIPEFRHNYFSFSFFVFVFCFCFSYYPFFSLQRQLSYFSLVHQRLSGALELFFTKSWDSAQSNEIFPVLWNFFPRKTGIRSNATFKTCSLPLTRAVCCITVLLSQLDFSVFPPILLPAALSRR